MHQTKNIKLKNLLLNEKFQCLALAASTYAENNCHARHSPLKHSLANSCRLPLLFEFGMWAVQIQGDCR